MFTVKKKSQNADLELEELKTDLKECDRLIKCCESLWRLTLDENLIEARIYQLLSLQKHREYIMMRIRNICAKKINCGE